MNDKLKRAIQLLVEADIKYDTIPMPGPTVRSRDVLDDVDPSTIVKTIMFKAKKANKVFSVSIPSIYRISYPKLRALMDDKISTLHPDEMRKLGWEPGECCPLTVPDPLFVDPTVLETETVHSGSGDLHYGLEYPSEAIAKVRNAEIVDLREDQITS